MVRDKASYKDVKLQGIVYLGIAPAKTLKTKLKLGKGAFLRSATALYRGSEIGDNLQTGHNVVVRENNLIGDNVVIGVNSYLGPGNKIGNNVRIHTGVFLENVTLEDNVIIGPGVIFINDPYPPCKQCTQIVGGAHVAKNAVIGANASILAGIQIGANALVGAGSVVTKNIPANSVVAGNPAKVINKTSKLKSKHKHSLLK